MGLVEASEALRIGLSCSGPGSMTGCSIELGVVWITALVLLLGVGVLLAVRKLYRGLVTVRARAFGPALSRRLAYWVRSRDYAADEFFRADGAGAGWAQRREGALERLADHFRARSAKAIAWSGAIRDNFSDLRFTDAGRVPFPFARLMREKFNLCSVVTESDGPRLRDLDGNWSLDLSGSYGVNVAGQERYKQWMRKGMERVEDLGVVLGPLHPIVAENIDVLKKVSRLDEVSFHMSGTEAVMSAVRLARFNTRRRLIVCFSGAYHGWWDGVQPGLGSERDLTDCLTLKDMDPASLAAIRRRSGEVAGVLVNPVQSFHPNSPPPSDALLLTSSVRRTREEHASYQRWLHELREVCAACDVPLIFDEVYSGFRLAPGGAQEFFDVQADMVVYGKTVAGGMPIGAVCGRKDLMRRTDPDHPMRLAYVIGTFAAHPVVMGAMNEFLRWVTGPEAGAAYNEANHRCSEWARETNQELAHAGLPLRVVNLATVWTVLFQEPGRYNWLLQYYLRAEGVTLSWVGTGRCISNMGFSQEDYRELKGKLVNAARAMHQDGWWLTEQQQPSRDRKMRRGLVHELLGTLVPVPKPLRAFCAEVMRRKHDDHEASHSHPLNQFGHILSSSVFIYCYFLIFANLTTAVSFSLAALLVRQLGHAVIEPPCHDKEELLLGYNTSNKTIIVLAYVLIPFFNLAGVDAWTWAAAVDTLPAIAKQWFGLTLIVVLGRVAYLTWLHDFRISMVWFIKLITDPLTDLIAYVPRSLAEARAFLPPYSSVESYKPGYAAEGLSSGDEWIEARDQEQAGR